MRHVILSRKTRFTRHAVPRKIPFGHHAVPRAIAIRGGCAVITQLGAREGIRTPDLTLLALRSNRLEQVTGIGPVSHPWEGYVLPLNYTCLQKTEEVEVLPLYQSRILAIILSN